MKRLNWYICEKTKEPLEIIYENGMLSDIGESKDSIQVMAGEGASIWEALRVESEFLKKIDCLFLHEDLDLFEITKEGLQYFIDGYKKTIVRELNRQLKMISEGDTSFIEHRLRSRIHYWGLGIMTKEEKTHDNDWTVTGSDFYTETIYNLVNLYKNLAWNKYKLFIIYG